MDKYLILKAIEIYNGLDENNKAVVAFGMTPMEAAEELEAFAIENEISYESKDIALAFMKVANMPGNVGMVV